jgi:putative FmdB family regulatory protein
MPLYEYKCTKCGTIIEVLQKFSDDPLSSCRECSGKLKKLISRTSFQLKGSGWYVTDYGRKNTYEKKREENKKVTVPETKKSEKPAAPSDKKE